MYMTGFFPFMMFGLPAACIAMYQTAKPGKKKIVYGLLASAAFCSFFTGVTEPIEFSFMFLAPGLYVVHALLAGITAGITVACRSVQASPSPAVLLIWYSVPLHHLQKIHGC